MGLYVPSGLPNGVLYSYGKMDSRLGGFDNYAHTLTLESDHILVDDSATSTAFRFRSTNKIDITGYTTLRYVVYISNPASIYQFGLANKDTYQLDSSCFPSGLSKGSSTSGGNSQTIEVDISGKSGEYYIAGYRNSANKHLIKIYEISLL